MLLSQALRLSSPVLALGGSPAATVVSFVGGGGKSIAMFRLAAELAGQGQRVVMTTTTHLSTSQLQTQRAVLRYDGTSDFPARVVAALAADSPICVVGQDAAAGRVAGIPPAVVDAIARGDSTAVVLVEADGARLRPFKAPAAHEPVLPASTTVLVPVAGITAVGTTLDAGHVHRPEIVARLANAAQGQAVTTLMMARVLTHSEGGLKGRRSGARVVVLLNQVETEAHLNAARTLARLLLLHPAVEGVALATARDAARPVRETRRRVGAIVLAAGAGTRMGDRVKQLLPWAGKTLVENAVDVALHSAVDEKIVVLGAHADEIRPVLGALPVRVVTNPQWVEGHSTSIRLGLRVLSPSMDAAIFINADQPFLTPEIVNAIIQRYAETDATIVAPVYAGKRGSPVLFRRTHFDEFQRLRGEEGGREVLVRHPVEVVSFPSAEPGIDVDTPEDYAASLGRAASPGGAASPKRKIDIV